MGGSASSTPLTPEHTWKKIFQKCRIGYCARDPEQKSNSMHRLISKSFSRRRSRSFSGVTPLPATAVVASSSSSPDASSSSSELLELLIRFIEDRDKPAEGLSPTSDRLTNLRGCVQNNFPLLGNILDKFGGAVNGQVSTSAAQATPQSGSAYREVAIVLRDLGHLHWVGGFLIIVAVLVDKCCKVSRYDKDSRKYASNLKLLAKTVYKIHHLVPKPQDDETLQKAVQLLINHAESFSQRSITRRSWFKRFLFAEQDHEELAELQNEINDLYPQLCVTAQILTLELLKAPLTDNQIFEAEDTVLVGDEKPVEEALAALLKLQTRASKSSRPCALLLSGSPGVGKSRVGRRVLARLRMEKYKYCEISMRNGSVKDWQDRLRRELSTAGIFTVFCYSDDGQEILRRSSRKELGREPILLYLDNVQKEADFDTLLPGKLHTLLDPGSILVVTTTNQKLINTLQKKGVLACLYEVRALQEIDATELLLRSIFGESEVLEDSQMVEGLIMSEEVQKLENFLGGVPLGIISAGKYIRSIGNDFLREKKFGELSFQSAYAQMDQEDREKFMEKFNAAVRHSFISLSNGDPISNEKSALDQSLDDAYRQLTFDPRNEAVFLDIVHLYVGHKWADVQLIYGEEILNLLQQLSMVYKDGTSVPVLQVSGLLTGMGRKKANIEHEGRWVVKENDDTLHKCFHNDQLDWSHKDGFKGTRLIKLGHCTKELCAERFDRVMPHLEHLDLFGTKIKGRCSEPPAKLRYFRCQQSSVPFLLSTKFQHLAVLDVDLRMYSASDLDSIESMPSLQKLKLKSSKTLRKLGPKLEKLRKVMIQDCPNFESLGNLNRDGVTHVEIVHCPKFSDFAGVIKLKRMKSLILAGFEFTRFPDEFVIPSAVQIMDLSRNQNLKELPAFGADTRIRSLSLRYCSSLQKLPALPRNGLQYLDLGGCVTLESFTLSEENRRTLKYLDVHGCAKLRGHSNLQNFIESTEGRSAPALKLMGKGVAEGDDTLKNTEHSYESLMASRFDTKMEEDDAKRTVTCPAIQRCFKVPWRRLKVKGPERTLYACCTWPRRVGRKTSKAGPGRTWTFPPGHDKFEEARSKQT
ncbi:hypothetical protein Mapa_001776 [Marchantia paleacea]|nr:hypothetical protein Mapa_001776 [Marchantia paleacea]